MDPVGGRRPENGGIDEEGSEAENDPWIPYSYRARTSLSPAIGAEPTNGEAQSMESRYQLLYHDNELRQRRWIECFKSQCQTEEDARRLRLQPPGAAQSEKRFDRNAFLNWYDSQIGRYMDRDRRVQRHLEDEEEEEEEREFAPSVSPPVARRRHHSEVIAGTGIVLPPPIVMMGDSVGGGSTGSGEQRSRDSSSSSSARFRLHLRTHLLIDELVAAQGAVVDALRVLDVREREQRCVLQRSAVEQFDMAVKESGEYMKEFIGSTEGQDALVARSRRYIELNPGLDAEEAFHRAHSDFAAALEDRLREAAASNLRHRARRGAQRLQLERLTLVRELIQLQKRYEELLRSNTVPRPLLRQFDAGLVARLRGKTWYSEARALAERMLRSTGDGTEPGATVNGEQPPQESEGAEHEELPPAATSPPLPPPPPAQSGYRL